MATADFDRDGDLDVLFVDSGEGVRLLRNDTPQGRWIQLRLRAAPAADGTARPIEGARVLARAGDIVHRRTVSGVSYLSQSSRGIHIGLGDAKHVDELEIRWPSGHVQKMEGLATDEVWELHEGEPVARQITPLRPVELNREQTTEFWRVQRAAVKAMKVEEDLPSAIDFFRQALELDPHHEDSIYYLGNCLAEQGDFEGALARFAELKRLNPSSHRAFKRWGTLRAMNATTAEAMTEAAEALARAVEINPEATGARMVLAETSLVRGDLAAAEQGLRWIQGTNPTAGDALFLLGYVSWKRGDSAAAREWLSRAAATGEDWRPQGVVAEGDVERAMHRESTLLGRIYTAWNRQTDPDAAYDELEKLVLGYRID
jgi:Tfp pilus assembly protein PilF